MKSVIGILLCGLCLRSLVALAEPFDPPFDQVDPSKLTLEGCQATSDSFKTSQGLKLPGRFVWTEDREGNYKAIAKKSASCYGIYYSRNDILDSCAKYPINFNKPCSDEILNKDPPLGFAVKNLNKYAVSLLLAHGADASKGHLVYYLPYNISPNSKESLATWGEILEVLVQHGANINDRQMFDGQTPQGTPFLLANRSSNEQLLNILIAHGADINATDQRGCSSLDDAYDKKDSARISYLETHGAKKGLTCEIRRAAGLIPYSLCIFGGCSGH